MTGVIDPAARAFFIRLMATVQHVLEQKAGVSFGDFAKALRHAKDRSVAGVPRDVADEVAVLLANSAEWYETQGFRELRH